MSNREHSASAAASEDDIEVVPDSSSASPSIPSSSSALEGSESTRTRENARRRKIENENRRSMIWQSEGMQAPPSAPTATTTPAVRASSSLEPPALPHPSHKPQSKQSRGSLLDEKRSIAGRRMSSRRSQLSTISSSQRSMDSALSEKESISRRSHQRVETRQAAWRIKIEEQEEEYNLAAEPADAKPGTAETILPTLTETMDLSESTAPPPIEGTSWPGGENLVTAVVVDEDLEQPSHDKFVSEEIAIATHVEKEKEHSACRQRLPALLCLALVCILAINVGIVVIVLQSKNPPSTADSAALSDWNAAPSPSPSRDTIQPQPADQDDPTQPSLARQTIAPMETPLPPPPQYPSAQDPPASDLNNGRPGEGSAMPYVAPSLPPTTAPTPVPTAHTADTTHTTESLFLRSAPPTTPSTKESPWVHFVAQGNGDENGNGNSNNNGNNGNGNGNRGNENSNGNGNGNNNNNQGNGNGNNGNGNWRGNGNGNNNNQGNGNGNGNNNWRRNGNGNSNNQSSP